MARVHSVTGLFVEPPRHARRCRALPVVFKPARPAGRAGGRLHEGDGVAELLGGSSCAMVDDGIRPAADADGFGAARYARRSDTTARQAVETMAEDRAASVFHFAIQRNGSTRNLVASALDS